MNLSDINNLDMNNPASWPEAVKVVAMLLLLGLVVAAGWWFDWRHQMDRLQQVQAREGELRQQFETKQRRAANLEAYERQLEEMRESFGAMLRQLPSRAEVSRLLVDISQTGLASGLEFELFKPENPVRREFYAELPVTIRVRGSYGEFARFVSGVANLPRIVTLDNVQIGPGSNQGAAGTGDNLIMSVTARTYWYLDEEEAQ